MSVASKRSVQICEDIRRNGYARIRLNDSESFKLAKMKFEALKFFSKADGEKNSEFFSGKHIGYRPVGGEYVGSPENWDINESLNYSEMESLRIRPNSIAQDFYRAARDMFPVYDSIIQGVLRTLLELYRVQAKAPKTRGASWIQVNYYRASVAKREHRDLMQGKHEDGHLLTLWNSSEPGLEIFCKQGGDRPSPICLKETELLAIPGDLLSLLTGGELEPLYHQVRLYENVDCRLAAMYFPNPETKSPLHPFVGSEQDVDIAKIVREDKLLLRPGAKLS